jgi:hypothetical protein
VLQLHHIHCLGALRAALHGELDPLALIQVAKSFASDGGVVDEDIVPTLSLDEPIALGTIEPLDGSGLALAHSPFSPSCVI